MRQIKAHARDSKKVEGNIFETGKKLRALLEENHRFNVVSLMFPVTVILQCARHRVIQCHQKRDSII